MGGGGRWKGKKINTQVKCHLVNRDANNPPRECHSLCCHRPIRSFSVLVGSSLFPTLVRVKPHCRKLPITSVSEAWGLVLSAHIEVATSW